MVNETAAVNKARLAFHMHGNAQAPTVVLLHSLATHSEIWRPQLAVWSGVFRVICIDLAGHGASPAVDELFSLADHAALVEQVLDTLAVQRAAIVGLSLGGMVAQALALRSPARVRALVLAHTSAQTTPAVHEIWQQRLAQFEQHGLESQIQATLARWFTPGFVDASPMTMDWVAQQIRSTTAAGYSAAIRAIQGLNHLDRLANIKAPTIIVAGDSDAAVPPQLASAMAARLPHAGLLVLKDAGHIGNVQQAHAFTESVGRFLREAPA